MMKIRVPIVSGIVLSLAVSASAVMEVVSDNYYSMLKVQTRAKTAPLAIPFVALEAATNQRPISVAEAVDARTLVQGDMLMIYDHSGKHFNEYDVLVNSTWAAREVHTLDLSGDVETSTGDAASEMKVDPGYGSWLMRGSAESDIVLHGQLPYNATVTVNEGKNLIGSVKLASTDINNCGIDWIKAGVKVTMCERVNGRLIYDFGDSIVFMPTNSTKLETLYFCKQKVSDLPPKWMSIDYSKNIDPILPAGCACWFIHKGDSFKYEMDPEDTPDEMPSESDVAE